MEKHRRKALVVAATVLVGVVLLGGAISYAFWDYCLEDHYIRQLEAGDWISQSHAAMKLGQIRSRKAVPALARLILISEARESPTTRDVEAKARKLREFVGTNNGEGLREPMRFMEEILGSPQVSVRMHAIAALGAIGPAAAEAVPSLMHTLKDSSVVVRAFSAQTLGSIGQDSLRTVPALAEALQDAEEPVRRHAAMALAKFGRAALPAVEALKTLLADPDPNLRRIASESLERIEASE